MTKSEKLLVEVKEQTKTIKQLMYILLTITVASSGSSFFSRGNPTLEFNYNIFLVFLAICGAFCLGVAFTLLVKFILNNRKNKKGS